MWHRAFVTGMLILAAAAFTFFLTNDMRLNNMIRELDKKKEKEIIVQVAVEKEAIGRDLEEKYRADMVSFQAMHKRLEIEKQRVRDLETRLKAKAGG